MAKNNGSNGAANGGKEEDPIVVLKKLFKPKEFGGKILDKNHIANKYRQKYLEDMKKERRKAQAQQLKVQKQYEEDSVMSPPPKVT